MALTLTNNTRSVSKIGYAVQLDTTNPAAFTYALPNSTKVIGVVAESVPYRAKCKICTSGEKALVAVNGNIVKDDVLRLSKTTDRISLGASTKAKSGDVPFVRIGIALTSGNNLVSCLLDLTYSSSSTVAGGITTPASFPYTVGATDILIVCDSLVAVTVNLPVATGSSREIQIANVNIGEVTVEGAGTDEINGELNQPVYEDNCIAIKDYKNNNWVII